MRGGLEEEGLSGRAEGQDYAQARLWLCLHLLGFPGAWLEPHRPGGNHPDPSAQLGVHKPCPWPLDLLGASLGKKWSQGHLLNTSTGLKAFSLKMSSSWAPGEMEAAPSGCEGWSGLSRPSPELIQVFSTARLEGGGWLVESLFPGSSTTMVTQGPLQPEVFKWRWDAERYDPKGLPLPRG